MKLHNLDRPKVLYTKRNVLVVVKHLVKVVHLQKEIRVNKAVQVINENYAHEGGQMPIQRRVPKRGFKNINRIEYKVFNLGQIDQLIEKYGIQEFSLENLYTNGLISQTDRVKILGNGELKAKIAFKVNAISEKAKSAIEASGGTVEVVK